MTSLQPGESLGPYQIIGQVGKGGMATVYKAFHAPTNRFVAVKVLPEQLSEEPKFIERFRQEAQTIANLQHPRILPVFDYGESQGHMYMVMRHLDTGTLQDRLRARPLTLQEIDHFLEQLADALSYAHAHNVVHRDIKPSNVLVDAQDNLFLTDFGIAKLLERSTQFTEAGMMTGTPDYMSPEQAQGLRVDQRSDIYSLGIILYEMITGQVPFEAETPLAVILKHISAPLPPPSVLKPGLSPDLERVILKALAKKPEDRFGTCAELMAAWRQGLKGAEQALTTPPAPPVGPASPTPTISQPRPIPAPAAGRNDTWLVVGCLGLAGVLLCVLAAGGGTWALALIGARPSPAATTRAAEPTVPEATRPPAAATRAATATGPVVATRPPASAEPATLAPATLAPALPATATAPAPVEVVNLSNNPGESEYPALAVDDDGTVRVLWIDQSLRADSDVLYRRLSGGEWSEAENLTDGLRPPVAGSLRWLRKPSGEWCAVWAGGLDWQMRCLDGEDWSPPARLRTDVSWADKPNFAYAADGSLAIAHVDFDVVMFADAAVSDGQNSIDALKMVLDADGNPHLVWIEQAGEDFVVKGRYSPDGGSTWEDVETLSDADTHAFLGSALDLAADSAGNVHLVWIASPFVSSDGATFYRRWSPEAGWDAVVELPGGRPLTELSLALDGDGLARVAAVGLVGQARGVMYFRQDADGGWSPARLVSADAGTATQSRYPSLFIDSDGAAQLVWQSADNPPEVDYAVVGD